MDLTAEQRKAYDRFIKARNKMGLVRTAEYFKNPWIRCSEVLATVDVEGLNHPLYVPNEDWIEYLRASEAWWSIEPKFRRTERMSATRGDYGTSDSWEEMVVRVRDTFSLIKEGQE